MNIAYLVTSLLAACCGFSLLRHTPRAAWPWLGVSAVLIVLLAFRAAEAGLWLDPLFRHAAQLGHWYEYRRPVQVAGILAVAGLFAGAARAIPGGERTVGRLSFWPVASAFLLACFAVVRGSSLHWADAAFDRQIAAIRIGHLFQAVCLAVIALAAVLLLMMRGPRQSH